MVVFFNISHSIKPDTDMIKCFVVIKLITSGAIDPSLF